MKQAYMIMKPFGKMFCILRRQGNFRAQNNNGFLSYKIKVIRERILSFFRHIYANSLNKFSFIFNPILITILIIINFVTYFLNLKKNTSDDDVMKNIEPESIT